MAGKKFHQTPIGNILCALIGIGLAFAAYHIFF